MTRLLLTTAFLWMFSVLAQTPPTAQFTTATTTVCAGVAVNFTNQSTAGSSAISSYSWDFGDGSSSTVQNASHVYTAAGTYTVTLVAQASNGQADAEVKTNYITVNPTPVAGFSFATNGCTLPVGVNFTNTSSGGASYSWNFGNNTSSVSQTPATVSYTSAGTYNVTLITTNSFGCKDTAVHSLVINNFQAGISMPATACQGTAVTINDNSTAGANSWNWSFPSGTPGASSQQNNTVVFNTAGTYTVSLTAQNTSSGCNSSTTQQITVLPKPTPSFSTAPTTGCAPLVVTFTNNNIVSGATYTWNFGDGSSTYTGATPPVHTYTGNGAYNATLTMTGSNGCSSTITLLAATLTSPVAAFNVTDTNGCAPLTVQFSDNSTAPDPISTWIWSFGDGTTYSGQTPPAHTYPVGVYTVSLTVTTQSGCVGTTSIQSYIEVGHIDNVNFSITQSPECAKKNIQFTDLSSITIPHQPNEVTYLWNFGDGSTSTQQSPTHQYSSDTGYFDVTLIVTFRGCSDTLVMPNAVYIKAPISRFSPSQSLFCNPSSLPVTVTVNDNSIIGQIPDDCYMIWRWGDGTADTHLDDPDFDDANLGTTTHSYTNYGSYTIKQVIYNYTTGCQDSTTQVVHVSKMITHISTLNDSICVGTNFNVSSVDTSSHVMGTFLWNMGNGTTFNVSSPTYAYPAFGTYTISLTATNSVGCSGSASYTPFTALALPQAALVADDDAGCAPFLVTFDNNSTAQNNGVALSSFQFAFSDDNSTQATTNVNTQVQHTFNSEGTFSVSLTTTDVFGCVSPQVSIPVTVTKPTALFTVDSVVCNLENFSTVNGSTGVAPLTYEWFVDGVPNSVNTDLSNAFTETQNNSIDHVDHVYTLITTDANGCKDTASSLVVVSLPVADFSYSFSGAATNSNGDYLCPPVFGSYTNQSDSYGNLTGFHWTFGDGKSSTLENPGNTYVFPGTYTISFEITDEFGCTADTQLVDYLTIFGPVADPSWDFLPGNCNQLIEFTLNGASNVTAATWSLGDGTTVNDSLDFAHLYMNTTTYIASVTVYDSNNCQVVYPMDTIVIPDSGLDAFFVPSSTNLFLGEPVLLDDQSSSVNPIVSWSWDFGNGTGSTLNNDASQTVGYDLTNTYVVTLTVVDENGCISQYLDTVVVGGEFNVPNVLTANGDGTNDFFSLPYEIFAHFDIFIVNRWGETVHKGINQTGTVLWDGRAQNGDYCADGVYFYKLKATLKSGIEIEKDGFVTLIK